MFGLCCSCEPSEPKDVFEEQECVVKQVYGSAVSPVQEVVEQAEDVAQGGVFKVAEQPNEVKEQVEDTAEHAKSSAQPGADAAAEAAADTQGKASERAEEKAADVKDQVGEVLDKAKEGAAASGEAVANIMTAAMAAVTDAMLVEFYDGKGSVKSLHFKTQALGFSCARAGGGCGCMSAPKQQVLVRKVEKNLEAEELGLKRGWVLKAVNGTDVISLEEANRLLADGASHLSQVQQIVVKERARAMGAAMLCAIGSLAASAMTDGAH